MAQGVSLIVVKGTQGYDVTELAELGISFDMLGEAEKEAAPEPLR